MMVKRGVTKKGLGVTIDKIILEKFNKFCEKNAINKSQLVTKLIKEFLEGKK